jgi:hypothetical protein
MANFKPYFLANSTLDQLPKKNLRILALDQKLIKSSKYHIRTFNQLPKNNLQILALDRNFLKAKIPLLEFLIK